MQDNTGRSQLHRRGHALCSVHTHAQPHSTRTQTPTSRSRVGTRTVLWRTLCPVCRHAKCCHRRMMPHRTGQHRDRDRHRYRCQARSDHSVQPAGECNRTCPRAFDLEWHVSTHIMPGQPSDHTCRRDSAARRRRPMKCQHHHGAGVAAGATSAPFAFMSILRAP